MSDELDQLFTRMKAQQAAEQAPSQPHMSFWTQPPPQPPHGYQPPSVSSPLFSPPAEMPQPHHPSNVISPASRNSPFPAPGAYTQPQEQNRAHNLLNLLRSNGSQPTNEAGLMPNIQTLQTADTSQRTRSAQQSHMLSASDLVNSLQRRPSSQSAAAPEPAKPFESTAAQPNTQDFLLNLLTKPSKTVSPTASHSSSSQAHANKKSSDAASMNKLTQSLANTSILPADAPQPEMASSNPLASPSGSIALEAPQPTKGGIFSYVNPFDQLHQSSPLNRTTQPQTHEKKIEILKHDRAVSDNLNGDSGAPAAKTRKLSSPLKKPTTQAVEPMKSPQSVSKKLEGISGQVHDEVAHALATAAKDDTSAKATEVAVPVAEKHASDATVDTDWSTAEDEDAKQEEDAKVEVFNFPMKPFVTLQLQGGRAARPFRPSTWESATPIARLKKEFSHDDRALATASQSHIIYAVVPNEKKPDAGLKIIRQEDGKNKHVWAKTGERLCNVQVSSSTHGDIESVLATGVNGTIFYTTLSKTSGELFDDDNVEAQGFVMSPPPNSDEPSSSSTFGTSSAIKTRAKLSNRHSDQYFAVARGRQIHLIAPEIVKDRAYTDQKTQTVHTEKYLSEHSLSINTAKAGKDFCFSEDDTTLISLDKVGKVKFWDIRSLTSAIESDSQDKSPRNELKEPIYSFAAGASPLHPDDKMSPSSVILLDKDRPCAKGVALRYLLVGFQQNHILQLWDLGLGKCVQELRFPESPGSTNAMCTVNYHPKSGILCVSHPGRNSIYFIHLSAPRYNLHQMSQAAYISMLARQDQSLPRPESTAIMSGMREYTLGKVGELRSVDMLKVPFPAGNPTDDAAQETLFELYIEHSKGVVGMLIKRDDLGWDAKGKMVKPKDAIEAGMVKVGELNPPRPAETPTASQPEILQRQPAKTKKDRETVKPEPKVKAKETQPSPAPSASTWTAASLPEPSKQVPEAPAPTNPPIITAASYAMAAQTPKSPAPEREAEAEKPAVAQESATKAQTSPKKQSPKVETTSAEDNKVQDLLAHEFAALYQKIDQDKRVADATSSAKQDAILRLVSSTLTENVESSLHKIVSTSIEGKVIPALTNNTAKTIERKLADTLNTQVSGAINKELKAAIPGAISAALRDSQVTRALSTHIVDEVTKQVKMDMGGLVQRSMQTVQTNMASQITQSTQSTQKAILDTESKLGSRFRELSDQQSQQATMLAQLTSSVRDLASMVQSMKEENGRLLSQISQQPSQPPNVAVKREAEVEPEAPQSEEAAEIARLTQMLKNAEYQQATIEWLQSSNQAELFDNLFRFLNPLYLQQVSSLVALSVSAAITSSFETNVEMRLEWLGTIVSNIDTDDPDIRDVAPKIMDVLYQRLQGAYMQLAESEPRDDNALRKMVALTRQIAEVRRAL